MIDALLAIEILLGYFAVIGLILFVLWRLE
jgi:hypothetical protein